MAQGEYINLNCTGSTANYMCSGTYPNGTVINLCQGAVISYEKCNTVALDKAVCTLKVNDDYSVTFNYPVPATSTVYPESWYTCENWLNHTLGQSVTTPAISKVTIYIFTNDTLVNQTIEITDPAELAVNEAGQWVYTTDPCQFNMYGQYIITTVVSWQSTTVAANNWGCWSDNLFSIPFADRPAIGIEINANGYAVGGTLAPYNPAANCGIVEKPAGKGQGKGKKPRV